MIDFEDKKIPKRIISKSTVYTILLFWKLRIFQNSYLSIRLGCWLACKWKERLGNTACESYTRCRSNAMSNELEKTNFPFRSTRPFELENRVPVLLLPATLNKWTREKKVSAFLLFYWNTEWEFPRKTKNIFFHFATWWTVCTLARIVSGISLGTICYRWFCPPLHLIPVWLNSLFPIITKKLSKIFSNTERRKLCSVRNGSSVSIAVNERGECTVVAVRAYLFCCTSFPF